MGFTQAQKFIPIIDTTEGAGRARACSQGALEVASQSLPEESSLLATASVCENDPAQGMDVSPGSTEVLTEARPTEISALL